MLSTSGPAAPILPPRDRILAAARELFYRHGIRAVGVETIAEAAATNKMTLYRHFGSKDELIAAYLTQLAKEGDEVWEGLARTYPATRTRSSRAGSSTSSGSLPTAATAAAPLPMRPWSCARAGIRRAKSSTTTRRASGSGSWGYSATPITPTRSSWRMRYFCCLRAPASASSAARTRAGPRRASSACCARF